MLDGCIGGGGLMQTFAKNSTHVMCPEEPKVARVVQILHILLIQDLPYLWCSW